MKKLTVLFIAFVMAFAGTAKADEGMWLLPLISKLNMNKMNDMGLKLTAEDIYSVNNSSLKDAIVIFGRGCTAEIISDQGLILTNHHCGYGNIQALSSVDHNYLKDGFWAKSLDQELPAEGLSITFLKRMEDVTAKVLEGIDDNTKTSKRNELIINNIEAIKKEAQKDNDYSIEVKSYFEGNQYFLLQYEKYNDIRFVGAPPSSIGKFGFDTDNWMWPRHTGDFSMFRVYADKDGKPAAYSKDNVPLKPKHHLPISLKGVQLNDFAMTLGYPGSTNRYLTSWGIEERMNIVNDARIVPRGLKQDLWQEDMLADEKINIQYASKFSRSSNYWKNSIGMNRGLKKLNVVAQKREIEKDFAQWVAASPERTKLYGKVLGNLKQAYAERAGDLKAQSYLIECMLRGTEIISLGSKTLKLEKDLEGDDQEKALSTAKKIASELDAFFKDYSAPTDHKVFAAMLKLYYDEINEKYHPDFFKDVVVKKYKGDFKKYADVVFAKSVFVNQENLEAFLAAPNLKKLRKDPVFIAAKSTIETYRKLYGKVIAANSLEEENNRLFLKGLMEMKSDKVFYPDANFTMRLSYGKVGNYEPKDAVIYKHYTTLTGVMEKYQPGNFEFEVPAKLMDLYESKDYGQYADADGTMHVCFTTDNDITGGNSGSPVINANGELFGLAFDGNWEAMSGDIAFETELQKCINVDIRYVLFIIDKYAGATNLIDEMTLVK
ncbi:S46 family peptidase [Saccharicrinis fermentans]|uniref:Dipeptidyl-peptidase n=1 Tax=Saccharicrinis fermentans DSM 9555 = JCM 21142 TaxID=869213 RepID=W7Y160_9BACT|nr:S46 family peptidase [Saccharicrinis fermentans]GAF01687.1 peptidase S46 [Saccharicrinis fermentans DSM 9555 = JCM 21142]